MVGRTFVPERRHGRVDHPHRHAGGHVARGHERDRDAAGEGAERHPGRRAARADDHRARPDAHPPARHAPPFERAEGDAGRDRSREMRRRLSAHPGVQADDLDRATRSAAASSGGFPISGQPARARSATSWPTTRSRRWRRRSKLPSLADAEDLAEHLESRRSTSPSIGGAPPISASGWRRSATRCG